MNGKRSSGRDMIEKLASIWGEDCVYSDHGCFLLMAKKLQAINAMRIHIQEGLEWRSEVE